MRINQTGNNQTQATETTGTRQSGKAGAARQSRRGETSSISDESGATRSDISARGKEFAQAKAIAGGTPDIREEKIAELKRRIEAGKYNVSPDAVADKMVDEHLKMSGMS